MNPVVHFEMPYEDAKRVADFYKSVFGWNMQFLPEMGSYVLAHTTPTDEKTTRPTEPGAINGGFFPKGDYGTMPHLVISVENIEEHIKIVKASGGRIEGQIQDIPGIGQFAMIKDSEGNRIGMLQPSSM